MNSLLKNLVGITLAANPVKESKNKEKEVTTRKRVEKNPTNGADIRIMSSGKAYPSQLFADKYGLEYTTRGGNQISNGIDLFRALDWPNYTNGGNTTPMLFGYVIPQNQSRIELFAGTRYDADGNPINSVLEQGSVLSDETLELIATGLGYTTQTVDADETDASEISAWRTMLGDKRYIDLKFEDTNGALTIPDGKYLIPKATAKGDKKGEMTSVKRERINIMLVTEFTGEQTSEQVEESTIESGEEVPSAELTSQQDKEVGNQPEFEDITVTAHQQFEDAQA